MEIPKITVVTVCYNAAGSIERTIKSVICQTYQNIEYIVIDGASKDNTLDIIKRYSDKITYWCSEPDKGIYDAMNKGINKASGDWICFMNAGDSFSDSTVIERIFNTDYDIEETVGLIYGDANICKDNKVIGKYKNQPFWKSRFPIRSGKGVCHQSCFVRLCDAKANIFDLSFPIAADFKQVYDILKIGRTPLKVDVTISDFDITGISCTRPRYISAKEDARILECTYNPVYWFYESVQYIKYLIRKR